MAHPFTTTEVILVIYFNPKILHKKCFFGLDHILILFFLGSHKDVQITGKIKGNIRRNYHHYCMFNTNCSLTKNRSHLQERKQESWEGATNNCLVCLLEYTLENLKSRPSLWHWLLFINWKIALSFIMTFVFRLLNGESGLYIY